MKYIFAGIIFIFPLLLSAQTKQELPPDFFDNFKYSFSPSFNYNDSLQLQKEVIAIAKELCNRHLIFEHHRCVTHLYLQLLWGAGIVAN